MEQGQGHSSVEIPEAQVHSSHSSHSRVEIQEAQGRWSHSTHLSVEIPEVQGRWSHSTHLSDDIPEVQGRSSFEIPESDLSDMVNMQEWICRVNTVRGDERVDKIESLIFRNCDGVEEAVVGPHDDSVARDLKFLCFAYVIKLSRTNLREYWQRLLPYRCKIKGSFTSDYCPKCRRRVDFDCESMILDGCFILEFFRFQFFMSLQDKTTITDHPIARVERRKLPIIFRDLLQLGNQIPFLVLEQLFQICYPPFQHHTLSLTKRLLNIIGAVSLDALGVGRDYVRRFSSDPERFERKFGFGGLKPLHLLDLIRLCFNSPHFVRQGASGDLLQWNITLHGENIPTISKLRISGIKVNLQNQDHYLDVAFQAGAIKMPRITLNELMCSFLKNCIEFEQRCTSASKPISSYVLLLDNIVDTDEDIDYLRQRQVLDHRKKTNYEAAEFINNLGTKINFDGIDSNFAKLCNDVNRYYQSEPRKKWVSFKREYFDKPWLLISVLAGSVLLILTCLQTYYTMHPQK